jgi:nicotinamidase/pyrazinamidase
MVPEPHGRCRVFFEWKKSFGTEENRASDKSARRAFCSASIAPKKAQQQPKLREKSPLWWPRREQKDRAVAMSNESISPKVTLLLVDVQKDFHPGGSLAIPTADADAARIAALIRKSTSKIDRIVATMDSHYKLHIAHPGFWVHGSTGRNPDPFTIITSNDVQNGTWRPRDDLDVPVSHWPDPTIFAAYANVLTTTTQDGSSSSSSKKFDWTKYCIEYTSQLEAKGRFQLCIWPEHCLIGSTGHGLVDVVLQAALDWSQITGHSIEWVMKGQNILTEMYSAMAAEVPITTATAFCEDLQADLVGSSSEDSRRGHGRRLLVCGQASSHCVNHTVRDIVAHWPADRRNDEIVVLSDCTSAVPGFETAAELFRADMTAAGVQFLTSTDPNVFSS